MYQYIWDIETGGFLLTTEHSKFSKEPRPVYYEELDILGFNQYWNYPKDDSAPIMWAEANNYVYKGKLVAKTKGGTLYNRPEIEVLEEPEPNGRMLDLVDIEGMCKKNSDILENLAQETIAAVYNTYVSYKNKVDVFYVAYSGGKDSVVALDIVERALPHDEFKVIFGDTGMEFRDTYESVELVKNSCAKNNIDFKTAKSDFEPLDSWKLFGPPCTVTRWCCSVHKTAPQILLLRDILGKPDFSGMAFVGVRAGESLARSKYDYVTLGGKHKGQYSCNVILDWGSAEVYLYIYSHDLILNKAYKKGNRRAGCLICPRAAERNDFMNHFCYQDEAEPLVDSIREAYKNTFASKEQLEDFIRNGGWKARKNGRDLNIPVFYEDVREKDYTTIIRVNKTGTDWREWIKTIGILISDVSPCAINFRGQILHFDITEHELGLEVRIDGNVVKKNIEFVKLLKNVFRKAACCVGCKECQADCPYGNLTFDNKRVMVSDACLHCAKCHKVEKGCLVYKSLERPKGGFVMEGKSMSLNSYSHHAPRMDWISQYFEYKNDFAEKHSLGSQMFNFFKRFLRDSKLLDETGFSSTAKIIENIGYDTDKAWGIIYTNLCYTPQVSWYVNNVDFNMYYTKPLIASMLVEAGAKDSWTGDIFSSLSRLAELPMGKLGFGVINKEKNRVVGLNRQTWDYPEPLVILYALYKFGQACDNYYQFSLDTLMDDDIDRNGISPTRIFGLDRNSMVKIVNGLSATYPDYINATFSLDLQTITLKKLEPGSQENENSDIAEEILKLF